MRTRRDPQPIENVVVFFESVGQWRAAGSRERRKWNSSRDDESVVEVVAENNVTRIGSHFQMRDGLHVMRDNGKLGRLGRLVLDRALAAEEESDRLRTRHHRRCGTGRHLQFEMTDCK